MRTYSIDGLESHVHAHIQLGHLFHSIVLSRPDLFQVVSGPAFALVTMAVVPRLHQQQPPSDIESYLATASANVLTKEVLDVIRSREDIYLLGVNINGVYAIRVMCAITQTEERHMWRAFDILVRVTEEVLDRHAHHQDLQLTTRTEGVTSRL